MKVKEEIRIELTVDEVMEIFKDRFSDKYDVENVYFHIATVYDDDDLGGYGSKKVTGVRLVGKNKQS